MAEQDALDRSVDAMQSEAVNFADRWIRDSAVRQDYLTTVRRYARDIMEHVRRGEITPQKGAEIAHSMRNEILSIARMRSSDIGRAAAEKLKAAGRTLNELVEHYAQKLYGKPLAELAEWERDRVFLAVVESSGRARPAVTVKALRLARLGKGLLVVSAAIAVYSISTAEDKVDAAAHEAVGLGGGLLGGAGAGALAGLACGPGAPVCVGIGVFVGGVAGAFGADFLYDWIKR